MLKFLETLIATYGVIAVFFVGILEDILFFVPSSLVFMGAGFLLIEQGIGFWDAVIAVTWRIGIPAALGITFGSIFVYGAAYIFGKPIVVRFGGYLGITWSDIEKVQRYFKRGWSDEVVLFLVRAIPIFPLSVVSIAAGLIRIPWQEYVYVTLIGSFVRAFISALIGWRISGAYIDYAYQIESMEKYVLLGVLILIGVGYWYFERQKEEQV